MLTACTGSTTAGSHADTSQCSRLSGRLPPPSCAIVNAIASRSCPRVATVQSTDQELLNFGKDSDDEMDSEGEGEEDEGAEEADEGAGAQPPAAKGKDKAGVTLEMVEGWCTAAKENATLGAVRNIMKVRCATSCRGAVSLQFAICDTQPNRAPCSRSWAVRGKPALPSHFACSRVRKGPSSAVDGAAYWAFSTELCHKRRRTALHATMATARSRWRKACASPAVRCTTN